MHLRFDQLDLTDRNLIALLQTNARESVANLARKLGTARTTVLFRIGRPELNNIIAGYSLTLRRDVTDNALNAYVGIRLQPKSARVINEYCNPCEAIVQGFSALVQPLEGHETFTLDVETFEAFNTSGCLGTLCQTLQGRVRNLDYKTIRYPGHRDAMNFLLHDLRLIERLELLRQVLELAVPHGREDVVIVFASAPGLRGQRFEQETRLARIFGSKLRGVDRTAIELTTAAGVVGVFELMCNGKLPQTGFIGQEQVQLGDFLGTRVGQYYADLGDPWRKHMAPQPRRRCLRTPKKHDPAQVMHTHLLGVPISHPFSQ